MKEGFSNIHIRVSNRLLSRADASARELGISRPEFVRRSIERECAECEKLAGRRGRAAKVADGGAGE